MAVIVMCSATGAPGATTSALGLTLAWPRPCLLVDADRSGGHAVVAGYFGGADPQGRGLVELVCAHRERRNSDVLASCLSLDPSDSRAFLPGFQNPAAAAVFEPAWPDLAHAIALIANQGRDVIIDVGRIGTGLPRALVELADVVLVAARSSLRSIAATRLQLGVLSDAHELGLLVVGPKRPYTTAEISDLLGVDVWAELPWQPEAAVHFSDGEHSSRIGKTALWKGMCSSAEILAERVWQRHAEVVGA